MTGFLSGFGTGLIISAAVVALHIARRINRQRGRKKRMSIAETRKTVPSMSEIIHELADYRSTNMTPEEIRAMARDFYVLESLAKRSPGLFAKASGLDAEKIATFFKIKGI